MDKRMMIDSLDECLVGKTIAVTRYVEGAYPHLTLGFDDGSSVTFLRRGVQYPVGVLMQSIPSTVMYLPGEES